MADSKTSEIPSKSELTRREFLKLSATAVIAPTLERLIEKVPLPPEPEKEKGFWERNRFFENVGSIRTEEGFDEIEKELSSFVEKFGDTLGSSEVYDSFVPEEWLDKVNHSVEILKRIKTLYSDFDDEQVRTLLEDDFYEIGSKVWAILRTGEVFEDNPEEFAKIYSHDHFVDKGKELDPFIGEELFSLEGAWTTYWWRLDDKDHANKTISPVFWEIASGTQSSTFWWPKIKGTEGLINYTRSEQFQNRPSQVQLEVGAENPEVRDKIMNLLKRHKLDRSAPWFYVYESGIGWHGSFDPDGRGVSAAFYAETMNIESMNRYPHSWEALVLHEFGHAVNFLIPYLESDKKVASYRARFQDLLSDQSPYSPLERLFKPQGLHSSRLTELEGVEHSNETHKYINFAAVTNYPADEYAHHVKFRVKDFFNYFQLFSNQSEDNAVEEIDGPLIFRVPYSENQTKYPTFREFYESGLKIFREAHLPKMHPFEQKVFKKIEENLDLFDARERRFYYNQERSMRSMSEYFEDVVAPAVVADLFLTDFDETSKLILSTIPDNQRVRAKHYLTTFIKLLKDTEPVDQELFAELFHNSLRRRDEGIIIDNSIPESFWRKMDKFIHDLQDDLIQDGLAQHSPEETQVPV